MRNQTVKAAMMECRQTVTRAVGWNVNLSEGPPMSVFPLSSHDFTFKASHSHPGYQTRRPVLTPPLHTEGIPWSVLYLLCATRQMEGSLMTRCLTSHQCNQSPQTRAEADTWHRNMSQRCSHPRRRDGAGIICVVFYFFYFFFLFCVTVWNEHKRYY